MSKPSAKQVVSKSSKPKSSEPKHMKCYAIRDATTGLYSTGGSYPKWNAVGKRWSSIGHVKNHLHMWRENNRAKSIPRSWVVVGFELVETEIDFSIDAWALDA